MKLWLKRISCLLLVLLCVGIAIGCGVEGNKTPSESTKETTNDSNSVADTTDAETVPPENPVDSAYHYKNAGIEENGLRVAFGVLNETNFFPPNEEVQYYISYAGRKVTGKTGIVTISSDELENDIVQSVVLEGGEVVRGFTPTRNGVYTLNLRISGVDMDFTFDVGVVPPAPTANDLFSWSTQPYIARVYMGRAQIFGQKSVDRQENTIIETVKYMGLNCIREDSIYWSDMQPKGTSKLDFSYLDRLVKTANDNGIDLMYTIGSPPSWSWKDEYKDDEEYCYNVCPKPEYWEEFCKEIALHYKDLPVGNIIWEIWNEPDWEFFHGTKEDFVECLEIAARTIRQYDPDAFIISGGLTACIDDTTDFKWHKPGASSLYLTAAKQLIEEGSLNTYATHLHYPFNNDFFTFLERGIGLAEKNSGIVNNGAFNTESGVCTNDHNLQSQDNVAKALYFRTHGYGGFTVFGFAPYGAEDDAWSIFDGYLQPKKSAVSFTVMLSMIGQATELEKIVSDRSLYADIFYDGTRSVVTVYCDGEEATGRGTLTLPEGKHYDKYDLYGNPSANSDTIVSAGKNVVYLVYEGKVSASDFSYALAD